MAIRPEFSDRILAGTKRVEFRKRPLAADVTDVVIYASAPVSAIVGAFRVVGQDTRHPVDLWHRFDDVAGICRNRYDDYFAHRELGTGIMIDEVRVTAAPVPLSAIAVRRPPQSFQYLPRVTASGLLASMTALPRLARTA